MAPKRSEIKNISLLEREDFVVNKTSQLSKFRVVMGRNHFRLLSFYIKTDTYLGYLHTGSRIRVDILAIAEFIKVWQNDSGSWTVCHKRTCFLNKKIPFVCPGI